MDLTEIEPLLVRYFNNELSSAEAEKVAAWIAGSEEHRKTAEHLYLTWRPKPSACTGRLTPPRRCARCTAASGATVGTGRSTVWSA